jgi:hypothetical protein
MTDWRSDCTTSPPTRISGEVEAEMIGRKYGVAATPAWLVRQQLISGLRPAADFEWLAQHASQVG